MTDSIAGRKRNPKVGPRMQLTDDKNLFLGGLPEITPEQAQSAALVLAGIAVKISATPVDLDTALMALGIKNFLIESS